MLITLLQQSPPCRLVVLPAVMDRNSGRGGAAAQRAERVDGRSGRKAGPLPTVNEYSRRRGRGSLVRRTGHARARGARLSTVRSVSVRRASPGAVLRLESRKVCTFWAVRRTRRGWVPPSAKPPTLYIVTGAAFSGIRGNKKQARPASKQSESVRSHPAGQGQDAQ